MHLCILNIIEQMYLKKLLNDLTESSVQKICLSQTWYLLPAHGSLHAWRYVRRMGRSMVHRIKVNNHFARYLKTVSLDFEEDWFSDGLNSVLSLISNIPAI